ncbi:hypothetical protein AOLI_G00288870 [Acnodon oligacanthus]
MNSCDYNKCLTYTVRAGENCTHLALWLASVSPLTQDHNIGVVSLLALPAYQFLHSHLLRACSRKRLEGCAWFLSSVSSSVFRKCSKANPSCADFLCQSNHCTQLHYQYAYLLSLLLPVSCVQFQVHRTCCYDVPNIRKYHSSRDPHITGSPAQKMAVFSLSRLRFQICFILLLSITFIVSVTIFVFGIRSESSKVWFHNFAKLITFQKVRNQTLINMTSFTRHNTVNQQTSDTKHTAVTTMIRHNVTDTLSMESMTAVPVKESSSICYHEAYPHNYRFIIDEPHKCEQENPFLVLMVPVAPHELEARNAIRSTWGNESVVQNKTITVVFSLGLPGNEVEKQQEELRLESQQYHDLIQSDFMDSYLNLTIKTMVIMDWLATRCPQASYAMKVDSDMFLNLENLMSLLLRPDTPKENYMTGKIMWNIPVIRDKNSKWYVSKELYAEDYYPTYPLGMGYVFSNDLSQKIVEVSKEIKPFNIEDAYVGACLKRIGISPSDPPNPSQFKGYFSGKYKREEFASVITTILNSPQQLITFWQDLKRPT